MTLLCPAHSMVVGNGDGAVTDNSINGTASCGNEWLNNEVVRKHWNWTGVIETDCGAMNNPNMCGLKQEMVKGKLTKLDACPGAQAHAVQSIKATVDIECQGSFSSLPNATNYSEIAITQMQQAVARVFKGRFQIGEFDPNNQHYANVTNETVFSEVIDRVVAGVQSKNEKKKQLNFPDGLL